MARSIAIVAALGAVSGLFFLSARTFSPSALILVYLAQLPLFVGGLSMGVKGAAIAGAAGGVLILAESGLYAGTLFLLAFAFPAVLLVRQALLSREDAAGRVWWYPAGRLVLWLAGLGFAMLVIAAGRFAGDEGGLAGASHDAARLFGDLGGGRGLTVSDRIVAVLGGLLPALVTLSWLALTAINGVLAQGVLARFGRNRRPSPDMTEIELPSWAPWVLAVLVALAVLGGETLGYLGRQLLVVSGLAFFFAGLAVVHAAARRFTAHSIVLAAIYVALLFWWPVAVIAGLGFIEQWAGLRRRLAGGREV